MNLHKTYYSIILLLVDLALGYKLTTGTYLPKQVIVLKKTVHQLIGVPFANIPQPFKQSTEYSPNKKTNSTKADKWAPFCYQPFIFQNSFYGNFKIPHDYEMSLDCLYINIYVPVGINQSNLSVMFFIHGGSNAAGGSNFIDGTALAAVGNVIVAIPNYRLDVLGFLNIQNLKDEKSNFSGNYGLWDQILALKWLHKNCPILGCDKNSITVFGHSAGSADSLILALSKHAQPYIKRIIMQSGSGLAHWAYSYERHVLEQLRKYKIDTKKTLESLNFKNSKYINSLNDTFLNFMSITSCNLTHKYTCFKEKILNISRIVTNSQLLLDTNELKYLKFIHNLLLSLDYYEILNLLGYFQKLLIDNMDVNFLNDFYFRHNGDFDHLTSNKNDSNLYDNFMQRKNQKHDIEALHKLTVNKSSCHMDLTLIISSPNSINTVCEFFKSFKKPYHDLFSSKIIKYLMSCYARYFKTSDQGPLESLLIVKSSMILNELDACVSQGVNFYHNGQIMDSNVNSTLKEMSFLTENSNYLHKPTIDGELIADHPHSELYNNKYFNTNIDVLVGVTSTESFYFLLHEYNLNEIITQTFIYSSLINRTQNLLEKLLTINTDKKLCLCLKKNLIDFYGMNMSQQELEKGALKKRLDALDLMSDFDFKLPVITQMKAYLENKSPTKLYVYSYSHKSSFNYLMDHMKSFYKDYETLLKNFNKTVTPHFSELDFSFGLPILSRENLIVAKSELAYNYTQQEYDFSISLIEYWSNFAKHGDPNSKHNEQWEVFNATNNNIIDLNGNKIVSNHKLFSEWLKTHEFWYEKLPNEIYDECLNKLNITSKTKLVKVEEFALNNNRRNEFKMFNLVYFILSFCFFLL